MSALAVARWAEFERDFGPLTVHERLDALFGSLAYTVHASAGGKEPPEKFRVKWHRPMRWDDEQLGKWLEAEARKN